MKFAVVKINKNQYMVEEGKTIEVDKIVGKVGDKLEFPEVLLKVEDKTVAVGKPVVANSMVTVEVMEQKKTEKVRTVTFKAKARQRKIKGQRAHVTMVKITKIS
jgi:large subunit ribosomal protein L21